MGYKNHRYKTNAKLKLEKLDNYQASLWLFQNTIITELEKYLSGDVYFKGKYKAFTTNALKSLRKGLGLIETDKKMTDRQVRNTINFATEHYKKNKVTNEKLGVKEINLPEFDTLFIPKIDIFNSSMMEWAELNKERITEDQFKIVKTSFKYMNNFTMGIQKMCLT